MVLFVSGGLGQGPVEFEVASIKPSNEDSPPMGLHRTAGQFTVSNLTVPFLIRWAYDLDEDRLVGAPKGLDSARFDIVAKIPGRTLVRGELQLMMQSLLAERFKLRIHREKRELTSYTLVKEKDGPKVHFVDLGAGFGQDPFRMTDRGRLTGTKVTAAMLAKVLAVQVGRPVEDQTGIADPFDFTLEWTPDTVLTGDPADAQPVAREGRNRPSIFTAVREQLGFRLNARKAAVEVIVVDRVESRPTEN